MGVLDGRVAIITGAGRGMGREHARLFAAEGASLVINDTGGAKDGSGTDAAVIEAVAEELRGHAAAGAAGAASGAAAPPAAVIASSADASTMQGAGELLGLALEAFGHVDCLVNNAGVLRDRMFVNMSEDDWDACISGHLRATFCPTRTLAAHWRDRVKAGDEVKASIVSMSSTSGLIGQVGQSNYGAAKAGIAALTVILADELGRYGVRVNAITPVARTRMTEEVPGLADTVAVPSDPAAFDVYHPGNVSPVVAWLSTRDCPVTGRVYYVKGGEIREFLGWHYGRTIDRGERFDVHAVGELLSSWT